MTDSKKKNEVDNLVKGDSSQRTGTEEKKEEKKTKKDGNKMR